MDSLAQNIKYYRKLSGLTQKELAKKLSVAPTAISAWEVGRNQPLMNNIEQMSAIFGIKKSLLLGEDFSNQIDKPTSPIQSIYDQLEPPRQGKVLNYANEQLKEQNNKVIMIEEKLFEYRVFEKLSAGTGFSYFNDGNYDTVFYDKDLDHDFASWVFGDSMEPKYMNGEVVLIKETGFDYDGAIYAVDWDGQTYIKKVYKEKDGLRLVSINNKYKDKFAPFEEDPRIIGKIVGNFMPIEN